MIIDKHLYIGMMPDKSAYKIIRKIKKFKFAIGVCVVTLPLFEEGMLEVYDLNEFHQPFYKRYLDDVHIVGIALTKRQAYRLVRDIVSDVYIKTGGFNCKDYFLNTLSE